MTRSTSAAVGLTAALALTMAARGQLAFQHVVIDPANPADPHCKALGDVDGDGLLDAVVASSSGAGMHWYEAPGWARHAIRATGSWTTDMQLGDVDGDGDLDVVIPHGAGLSWYENPRPAGDPRTDPWDEHPIGAAGADAHDVEIGDLEPDGDLDVVSRRKGGGGTTFWRQTAPDVWAAITVTAAGGEGTALGDLDGDGDLDVAQNGFWVEQVDPATWVEHPIDGSWPADVGVLVADVDGNGAPDIVLAPSESGGRFSWVEAIDPVAGPWLEHSIDPAVSYFHTFEAADMDDDGDLDLVTAEMHQSSGDDEVSIYFNDGAGTAWSQQVIATSGSHNVRVGDVGGDGDLDVFGANWSDGAPNSAVVELWENVTSPLPLDAWRRHLVETSLPWNAVFVVAGDLDGDGLPDLATGGWWYPNPGSLGGAWPRQTIGAPLHNVAAIHDFDRDGDLDLLGTDGQVGGENFAWAENDGGGSFTIRDIESAATGGDFLQGISVTQVTAGGQEEAVLSWHNGGSGTAMLSIPDDPTDAAWPLATISGTTNQEAVPAGDVDGDGDVDVHLGTSWLRQEADGSFSTLPGVTLSGGGVPDRVVLADLDRDGDLDVVIGVEFATALVWGENDGAGGGWSEHPIAADFDYFSVGVADLDGDGDLDVAGGAHLGSGEVSIYENLGGALAWATHVVDAGDSNAIDHHDGLLLVDLDLDRDLDLVSIGWSKRSLVIYENLALGAGGGGGDLTPPALVAAHAPGPATRVLVEWSEPVAAPGAEDPASYAVSGGVAVLAAELAVHQRAATLTTTALEPAIGYVLSVAGVEDLAGNPIAPGANATFELGAADPTPGLVAWWPLERFAETMALDLAGGGHHAALAGGAAWSGGPALSLDGADGRAEAGAFDVAGSALTLAAWIYPEDLANCGARDCRVLSKATGTAEQDHHFMLSTIASGALTRLRFRLETGGTTTTLIAAAGDLTEGAWQHAAAVYDGTAMRLFLDGVEVGSVAKNGALGGDPAVPVWIGGNPSDPASKPWRGEIDDVRIYDRALSAGELLALPPPSARTLFTDGFESGGLSRWRGAVGSVQVLAAAARAGTRGARVQAGSDCVSPAVRELVPPPSAVSGDWEACRELTAQGVDVVPPGAVFRAGESIALADFTAGADLALELDPGLTPFARLSDDSPASEIRYTAELDLRADGLVLGAGERLEHLVARDAGGAIAFRLVLEGDGGGGLQALLEARLDDGSLGVTPAGQEAAIPPGWHRLRVDWRAGDGDGSLSLSIDGAAVTGLAGLANAAQRVDAVEWGAAGGSLGGAAGFLDLDRFASW